MMIIVNLLHFDQIEPHLAFLLVAILNRSFEAESISFFRIGQNIIMMIIIIFISFNAITWLKRMRC